MSSAVLPSARTGMSGRLAEARLASVSVQHPKQRNGLFGPGSKSGVGVGRDTRVSFPAAMSSSSAPLPSSSSSSLIPAHAPDPLSPRVPQKVDRSLDPIGPPSQTYLQQQRQPPAPVSEVPDRAIRVHTEIQLAGHQDTPVAGRQDTPDARAAATLQELASAFLQPHSFTNTSTSTTTPIVPRARKTKISTSLSDATNPDSVQSHSVTEPQRPRVRKPKKVPTNSSPPPPLPARTKRAAALSSIAATQAMYHKTKNWGRETVNWETVWDDNLNQKEEEDVSLDLAAPLAVGQARDLERSGSASNDNNYTINKKEDDISSSSSFASKRDENEVDNEPKEYDSDYDMLDAPIPTVGAKKARLAGAGYGGCSVAYPLAVMTPHSSSGANPPGGGRMGRPMRAKAVAARAEISRKYQETKGWA